jgi:hypothetical protein
MTQTALRLVVRELVEGVSRCQQSIAVDRPTITIGRAMNCDLRIGDGLGTDAAMGISRVQATVMSSDIGVMLYDGTPSQPRRNRVWVDGAPIESPLRLVPGAEVTLYKAGHACVQLSVELPISNQETYTGDLLLEAFDERLTALTSQVELLTVQNEERTRSDQQQSQELIALAKGLRKVVSGSLIAVAISIGTFSLSGALSAEQRGEWQKVLVQVVQVVATVAIGGWGVSLNRPEQPK